MTGPVSPYEEAQRRQVWMEPSVQPQRRDQGCRRPALLTPGFWTPGPRTQGECVPVVSSPPV